MVLTACSVLSPVSGLFSHRRLAKRPARLDPSVGRSGPHALAVRAHAARLATSARPPHSLLHARDDAQRPSGEPGCAEYKHKFRKNGSEIFRPRSWVKRAD